MGILRNCERLEVMWDMRRWLIFKPFASHTRVVLCPNRTPANTAPCGSPRCVRVDMGHRVFGNCPVIIIARSSSFSKGALVAFQEMEKMLRQMPLASKASNRILSSVSCRKNALNWCPSMHDHPRCITASPYQARSRAVSDVSVHTGNPLVFFTVVNLVISRPALHGISKSRRVCGYGRRRQG